MMDIERVAKILRKANERFSDHDYNVHKIEKCLKFLQNETFFNSLPLVGEKNEEYEEECEDRAEVFNIYLESIFNIDSILKFCRNFQLEEQLKFLKGLLIDIDHLRITSASAYPVYIGDGVKKEINHEMDRLSKHTKINNLHKINESKNIKYNSIHKESTKENTKIIWEKKKIQLAWLIYKLNINGFIQGNHWEWIKETIIDKNGKEINTHALQNSIKNYRNLYDKSNYPQSILEIENLIKDLEKYK